ncbi:MAG: hypothetical protein GXP01_07760 [Alphaproteobacteria bacterium]|nr:hypothetical protein [Alphaproteobacteria bacterium]
MGETPFFALSLVLTAAILHAVQPVRREDKRGVRREDKDISDGMEPVHHG